jgi:hypothetical protein
MRKTKSGALKSVMKGWKFSVVITVAGAPKLCSFFTTRSAGNLYPDGRIEVHKFLKGIRSF